MRKTVTLESGDIIYQGGERLGRTSNLRNKSILQQTVKDMNGKKRLNLIRMLKMRELTYEEVSKLVNALIDSEHDKSYFRKYASCERRIDSNDAAALRKILGCGISVLSEVFTPPKERGVGDFWVGSEGSLVQDYKNDPIFDFSEQEYLINIVNRSLGGARYVS